MTNIQTLKRLPATEQPLGYVVSTAADCHSFYPYFEGISEAAYNEATLNDLANRKVTYQGKEMSMYDATQAQRRIERGIRFWKRRAAAIEAAGLDNTAQVAKVKAWQGRMRGFLKETGLDRDRFREQVYTLKGD